MPKRIVVMGCDEGVRVIWLHPTVILLAHGMAVESFRKMGCSGKIGITLDYFPADAASDSGEDRLAAALDRESRLGWFADPIFKGSYPERMWKHYQEKGVVMPKVSGQNLALIQAPIKNVNGKVLLKRFQFAGCRKARIMGKIWFRFIRVRRIFTMIGERTMKQQFTYVLYRYPAD